MALFADEEASKVIGELESFKKFRVELKEGVEVPPKAEEMQLVGSSFELFDG